MAIPIQKIISNGTVANDGTGDSLRDAATKINSNFTDIWYKDYTEKVKQTGREFVVNSPASNAKPNPTFINMSGVSSVAGTFADFGLYLRASWQDKDGKGIYTTKNATLVGASYVNATTETTLEIYQKEASSVARLGTENWILRGLYSGTVEFETLFTGDPASFTADITDCWTFKRDQTIFYTLGVPTAGTSLYIKINGLW